MIGTRFKDNAILESMLRCESKPNTAASTLSAAQSRLEIGPFRSFIRGTACLAIASRSSLLRLVRVCVCVSVCVCAR